MANTPFPERMNLRQTAETGLAEAAGQLAMSSADAGYYRIPAGGGQDELQGLHPTSLPLSEVWLDQWVIPIAAAMLRLTPLEVQCVWECARDITGLLRWGRGGRWLSLRPDGDRRLDRPDSVER